LTPIAKLKSFFQNAADRDVAREEVSDHDQKAQNDQHRYDERVDRIADVDRFLIRENAGGGAEDLELHRTVELGQLVESLRDQDGQRSPAVLGADQADHRALGQRLALDPIEACLKRLGREVALVPARRVKLDPEGPAAARDRQRAGIEPGRGLRRGDRLETEWRAELGLDRGAPENHLGAGAGRQPAIAHRVRQPDPHALDG
jgi:hypothetical protein